MHKWNRIRTEQNLCTHRTYAMAIFIFHIFSYLNVCVGFFFNLFICARWMTPHTTSTCIMNQRTLRPIRRIQNILLQYIHWFRKSLHHVLLLLLFFVFFTENERKQIKWEKLNELFSEFSQKNRICYSLSLSHGYTFVSEMITLCGLVISVCVCWMWKWLKSFAFVVCAGVNVRFNEFSK